MLTETHLSEALGLLVAGTYGWTDMTVEQFANELRELEDGEALVAACRGIVRSWSEKGRPSLSVILQAYDVELHRRSPHALDPARVHCDGTGWLPAGDGLVPCPRCNRALATVFADSDKLAQWRTGTLVEHLGVGVERVAGRLRYVDGWRAPVCSTADDDIVPAADGRRIAWEAKKVSDG